MQTNQQSSDAAATTSTKDTAYSAMSWQPIEIAPRLSAIDSSKAPKVLAARRYTLGVDLVWPAKLFEPASDGSSFFKAWCPVKHPDDPTAQAHAVDAADWRQIRNVLGFQDEEEVSIVEVLERISQLQNTEGEVLKVIRKQSGGDGYGDHDGVDVVQELREHLDEMGAMLEREQQWRKEWTALQRTQAAIAVFEARDTEAKNPLVQLDRETFEERLAQAREQGADHARDGVQDVTAGFDDVPFTGCPESWCEKPFARIVWDGVGGDESVGMQAQSGWSLARDQSGTVVGDLANPATRAALSPLETLETAYSLLANVRCSWPGRETLSGQQALVTLRDAIAMETGKDAREVQDAASVGEADPRT